MTNNLKKGWRILSSKDFASDIHEQFLSLAEFIVEHDYPNQHFFTVNQLIITPAIIHIIAKYACRIRTGKQLDKNVHWFYSHRYGQEFIGAINEVCEEYYDDKDEEEDEMMEISWDE